jgi:hypothetical protein
MFPRETLDVLVLIFNLNKRRAWFREASNSFLGISVIFNMLDHNFFVFIMPFSVFPWKTFDVFILRKH